MTVPPVPERLEKAILFLRGEHDGRAWLDSLPDRITTYADRWNLTLDSIADSGAMSCCVYCTTLDGAPAVLKIPVDEESGRTEAQLLDHWATTAAAPAILQRANGSGVFLMTRIIPGTIAWPDHDATDTAQFGELLTRLNTPGLAAPPVLKELADIMAMRIDWARDRFADPRYAEAVRRIGADTHLAHAETVLTALLHSTTQRHVLHADLQAKNILAGRDHWYTIDPLGAIGDINAEAALWIAIQDGPTGIRQRLDEFDNHPLLQNNRLQAWTYIFAVAEYRPYLPASAGRMEDFILNTDLRQVAREIAVM
jgi:streptomycin 6-kinase